MMAGERDFLEIPDFSTDELYETLALAHRMKSRDYRGFPLAGKTLALLFESRSALTRVSFEVGVHQLGGHALYLSSRDIELGRGESVRDAARALARYVDGIVRRTLNQGDLRELAFHADVPVINGQTDLLHPCQVLADLMTIQENFGPDLAGRKVAWIGAGNQMANSWLNAAYRMGLELWIACPPGYEPDKEIYDRARAAATVHLTHDPREAAAAADVVATDSWASPDQETESEHRAHAFGDFRVDRALLDLAAQNAIFLHHLPAHRGEEVSEEVIEGPRSRVFDEAENRLHVQKAIMARLMGA